MFGQEVLTPEAQLAVSREYLAVFFLAQLGGGSNNGASAATVREARRRMWGDESWTAGGGGGGMSRVRQDVRHGRPTPCIVSAYARVFGFCTNVCVHTFGVSSCAGIFLVRISTRCNKLDIGGGKEDRKTDAETSEFRLTVSFHNTS